MPETSVVGPKGQIIIPKSLRERYDLKEGGEVVLVPRQEGVLVKHTPSSLRGRLRGKLDPEGFEDDVAAIRAQWNM